MGSQAPHLPGRTPIWVTRTGNLNLGTKMLPFFSKSSGMDEVQVRESFNSWVAERPNGKMKPKDFREMMSKALPSKDASKMEKHILRIYDANNDGYIDFMEFMIIFHIMSDGTPEEVLSKIFRLFDYNSDGTITAKEMKRLVKD